MSEPAILCTGLDTLHVGVFCAVKSGLFDTFEGKILDARELQGLASFDVPDPEGGEPFQHRLFRAGGTWKWMLMLPGFWTVRLAHRGSGDPAPQMHLQLRSELLWTAGASRAVQLALDTLGPVLTTGELGKVQVSRADLTMDWCDWSPTAQELTEHVVRRARFASAQYEPSRPARALLEEAMRRATLAALRDCGGQVPLEAVAERAARAGLKAFRTSLYGANLAAADGAADQQAAFQAYWSGRTFTGVVFGKGSPRALFYRKDVEITQQSGKTWFYDAWVGDGMTMVPGEREQAIRDLKARPIWRAEFKLLRETLREWSIDTVDQLWPALPSLWRQLMDWVSLRVPSSTRCGSDQRRTRQRVRPEWAKLRDGWRAEREIPVLRKRIRELSFERSCALATLSTARAFAFIKSRLPVEALHDPSAAAPQMIEILVDELERRDASWTEVIEGYAQRLRRPKTRDAFSPGHDDEVE